MAVLIAIVVLLLCPLALCLTMHIVGKRCPTSRLGTAYNRWKGKRALSKEQQRLQELNQRSFTKN